MLEGLKRRPAALIIGVLLLGLAGLVGLVLLRGPRNFTVIVLPDTQYYAESYPEIFEDQAAWIVDQAESRNIVFVVHEGDIVEHYDDDGEWQVADAMLSMIERVVPLSVLPGNHDMSADRDTANFNAVFPAERFVDQDWYGGGYPDGTNDNSYQLFEAGGYDFGLFQLRPERFLIVNLLFCPTRDVVEWADGILKQYPDRHAILVTHAYLNHRGNRHVHQASGGCVDPQANTQYLFDELIYPNPNVLIVLSGHEYQPERAYGEAYRVDTNIAGEAVHQMLADYQRRVNGGDGWLRILGFNRELGEVIVRTYSPTVGSYERDEDSDFSFEFPEQGN